MKTYDKHQQQDSCALHPTPRILHQPSIAFILEAYSEKSNLIQREEATIGGDWEMKGRSDSNTIYNTTGNKKRTERSRLGRKITGVIVFGYEK